MTITCGAELITDWSSLPGWRVEVEGDVIKERVIWCLDWGRGTVADSRWTISVWPTYLLLNQH